MGMFDKALKTAKGIGACAMRNQHKHLFSRQIERMTDMKMNKRMLALLLVLVAVLCSACGSSGNSSNATQDSKTDAAETETTQKEKDLDEIKADLNANSAKFIDYFGEVYQVTDLELIKRNTKGDSDTVYCTVTLACDGATIVQDFKFSYNHYTTGGWILDEFEPTGEANMTDTNETAETASPSDEAAALGENSDVGCVFCCFW